MIDPAFVERVAERVVALLDKRESDKKALAEETAKALKALEKDQRRAVDEMKLAQKHAYQAECQHERKQVHVLPNGIDRYTWCLDEQCGKTWKTAQPRLLSKPTPIWANPSAKCDHTHDGHSTIHEIWSGVARCTRCMMQWGRAVI